MNSLLALIVVVAFSSPAGAQGRASAEAKEVPCEKNAEWDSKAFLLRIKKPAHENDVPREVRIRFKSCSRRGANEERWFSDTAQGIGFAVSKRVGTDGTSVSFFQTSGVPAKLCVSAGFGTFTNDAVYKTGYSLESVNFKHFCGGAGWKSAVQIIPLAF